jgi:hypothetical protein
MFGFGKKTDNSNQQAPNLPSLFGASLPSRPGGSGPPPSPLAQQQAQQQPFPPAGDAGGGYNVGGYNVNAQQAAGLASAAYSVHSALPPQMKQQVNEMASHHANNYVRTQLGLPPQPQAPPQAQQTGAPQTPTGSAMCWGLFGAAPPPAPATAGVQPTNGAAGGFMDFGNMLGMKPKVMSDKGEPGSFTNLWANTGDPNIVNPPPPPAQSTFDPMSLVSFAFGSKTPAPASAR